MFTRMTPRWCGASSPTQHNGFGRATSKIASRSLCVYCRTANRGGSFRALTPAPPLPDGTVIWNGFYQDITERKQAEDELKASEERFRRLFEDSADAMLLIDDSRFVECNAAAVAMLRMRSRDELLNHSPTDLSPPIQADGTPSAEKAQISWRR